MWFLLALIGYFLLAIVFVLDKYILTKSVSTPAVYTCYSTIFLLGVLLLLPFGGSLLQGSDWWWALASGVTFGLGLWAMFVAVKSGEASHINPFIGAVVTIATYGLSAVVFGEVLAGAQVAGVCILIFASLLLSGEKTRTTHGVHRGFLWAVAAGLFFAVSHVAAKYLYELYPFMTGFIWTRAATGLVGLFFLLSPTVRASWHKRPSLGMLTAPSHATTLIVVNKLLGIVAVVIVQLAIALGSVTLVNALSGLQYMFMFIMIVLSTKFFPKFFREYFTKQEFIVQSAALMLVIIGSLFFVV